MAKINIDELLAAKAEAESPEPVADHSITFRGQTFTVPAKPPALEISEAMGIQGAGRAAPLFRALLGDDGYERLRALKPNDDEASVILDQVLDLVGASPESSASGSSSPSTSGRSRPTSRGTTSSS